jgi:hypothetical protein
VRAVEFVVLTFDKAAGRGLGRRRFGRSLLLVLVVVVVSGGGDPIAQDGIQIVLDFIVVLVLLFGGGVTSWTGAFFVLVVGLIRFIGTSRVISSTGLIIV